VILLAENFLRLFVESAPWLMWGFLIAALMKSLIPEDLLARHLGADNNEARSRSWLPPVKAALLGAPLPLCSCGVIPAALGLRRAGASRGATMSFLISTPETGVDSVSISYAMLGPVMAIARPIAAICTAITAGLLVGPDREPTEEPAATSKSCCSKSTVVQQNQSLVQRLGSGLRFVYIDLVRDIAGWLLVGLAFAALVQTFVPAEMLARWGQSVWAYGAMAVVGVPMYICATASTPIAAGFLFAGVSPGAVLVFLLAGPATNMATMGLVKNELGGRALVIYLTSVVGVAWLAGALLDLWVDAPALVQAIEHQHGSATVVDILLAVTLSLLLARGLLVKWFPAILTPRLQP
jgi:uncharacterized membrane protein YraQ (UPF0718 family)